MDASKPWSGNYNVKGAVWVAAHTTQVFTFTIPHLMFILDVVCSTRMEIFSEQ